MKEAKAAARLRLSRRIEINGINPYVEVTAREAGRLQPDWRKPMPVRVQVNGKPDTPWRINLMPRGDGSFYLYLHGEVRGASGTGVGEVVRVDVAFDADYKGGPTQPMPEWFAAALRSKRKALDNWDRLPPSRQKEVIRYIAALKSKEARQRNLDKALHVLSGKEGRFMARDWKDGR